MFAKNDTSKVDYVTLKNTMFLMPERSRLNTWIKLAIIQILCDIYETFAIIRAECHVNRETISLCSVFHFGKCGFLRASHCPKTPTLTIRFSYLAIIRIPCDFSAICCIFRTKPHLKIVKVLNYSPT